MSGHKRNHREMEMDFQNFVGDMAEHKPSDNARRFFEHKPYAKSMKEEKKWKTMNIEGE